MHVVKALLAVSVIKKESCVTKHDRVRALIRSISTNQGRRTSGGITQPSKDMQIRLINEAYTKAGLRMDSTAYLEAHGMLSHLLPTLADTFFS
jgi:acyl transferase domain-containing protein